MWAGDSAFFLMFSRREEGTLAFGRSDFERYCQKEIDLDLV